MKPRATVGRRSSIQVKCPYTSCSGILNKINIGGLVCTGHNCASISSPVMSPFWSCTNCTGYYCQKCVDEWVNPPITAIPCPSRDCPGLIDVTDTGYSGMVYCTKCRHSGCAPSTRRMRICSNVKCHDMYCPDCLGISAKKEMSEREKLANQLTAINTTVTKIIVDYANTKENEDGC